MATSEATRPLDPSDYIAHHLQHFSASASSASPARIGYGVGLIWICALLAVLLAFLWFTEGRAMFRLSPPMNARQRVALWWSCAWRRWALYAVLVTGSCTLPALVFLRFVARGEATAPFPWTLVQFYTDWWTPALPFALLWLKMLLMPFVIAALGIPLTGYVTKHAFAAHALAPTRPLTFTQTVLLGWTTCFWCWLGMLVVSAVAPPVSSRGVSAIEVLALVPWSMYVVLPRQARRIARSGDGPDSVAGTTPAT